MQERFEKFKKVFPKSELTFDQWKKLKHWADASRTLLRLDTSIFPDCLESLVWNGYPLNTVIFYPKQSKLKTIDLSHTLVNKFILPNEMKGVTSVVLEETPITKLAFGGSTAKIEKLILSKNLPVSRMRLPSGMTSLKELSMGTVEGPITLPKDAVALEKVHIRSRDERGRVKIPAEWTKLEKLTVTGDYTVLSIPNTVSSVRDMILRTFAEKLSLPRIEGVKTLSIIGLSTGAKGDANHRSLKEVIVPNSMGETLETIDIGAGYATSISIPKSLPKLKSIAITADESAKVSVPKSASALEVIHINAGEAHVSSSPLNLKKLRLPCKIVRVPHAKELTKLENLFIPCAEELKANFPTELPNLEFLSLPTQELVDAITGSEKLVRSWGLNPKRF